MDCYSDNGYPEDRFDVILGSDIIYVDHVVAPLLDTVQSLIKPTTGRFLRGSNSRCYVEVGRKLCPGSARQMVINVWHGDFHGDKQQSILDL